MNELLLSAIASILLSKESERLGLISAAEHKTNIEIIRTIIGGTLSVDCANAESRTKMAISALEKQIPKPPKSIKEDYNVYCPTCGHDVGMYDAETGCAYMENKSNPRMCAKCGQLLSVKLEGE